MSNHGTGEDRQPPDRSQTESTTPADVGSEDVIGEKTSVEDIMSALENHGCKNLTSSIDLATCSERAISIGGFYDVYRGRLFNGKTVALKCLRVNDQEGDADRQKEKIFKHAGKELYQWSKLRHQNVLPLLGSAQFRGHLSMVSEWMIHGHLRSFLNLNPEADRIPFCMDIAAGLAHIHEKGMVHSDLKAENVVISPETIAMITDFGSSRREYTTLKFAQTSKNTPAMTFRWMAPELFAEEGPCEVSEETDVWAYGMTSLEALTGKYPLEDIGEAQFYSRVIAGKKNPPRPDTALSDDLWKIIESCWDRDPKARPVMKHISDHLRVLHPEYLSRWHKPSGSSSYGLVENSNNSTNTQAQPTSSAQVANFEDLGSKYVDGFRQHEELPVLNQAISNFCQAVVLSPGEDVDYARRLGKLGGSYKLRFECLGEISDVNLAIGCLDRAIQLTPSGHKDLANLMNGLGTSYRYRFERLGELSDIDRAIENQRSALGLLPDHERHIDKPGCLRELGTSYRCRFARLAIRTDIKEAIECQDQGLKSAPYGHEDRLKCLNDLGTSHAHRFEYFKDPGDLIKAIEYQSGVVQNVPDDHPSKPAWRNDLGRSYMLRFQRFSEGSDIKTAISHFEQATTSSIGRILPRFVAARQWAAACALSGDSPHGAYQQAMALIPHLISLGASIEQRCNLLVEVGDFAAEAAAWAISTREYPLALGWTEEGRLVLWNQIIRLQTRFDDLALEHPELARQLSSVGRELERAGNRPGIGPSIPPWNSLWDYEQKVQRHHHLAAEWMRLLGEARSLPKFKDLLRPHKTSELLGAAKDGPVVVVNLLLPQGRCDALILRPGCAEVSHVSLGDFPSGEVEDIRSTLRSLGKYGLYDGQPPSLSSSFGAGSFRGKLNNPVNLRYLVGSMFETALRSLWVKIVQPILGYLGYLRPNQTEVSIQEMPHITWCLAGPLSFLPLHAAGWGPGPNAMELVVSSYAPTLNSLLSTPKFDPLNGILAVRPDYPSERMYGFLGGAVRELSEIKKHAHATTQLQLVGKDAKVEAVLQAMERYSWVHLACHATQGEGDHTDIAFHLSDGNLTLSRLSRRSHGNKGLAFLSGCHTTTGDENLPYEGLNLAVGMLVSGYTSVIAAMWEILDEDAPEVAQRVYAELFTNGKMNNTSTARALHKAVMSLRDRVGKDSFKRWVPFVHIGL